MACVCHSLAACQRHTPSSLASVIGLSNNDVISLRSLRCVRCVSCVGWKPRLTKYGTFIVPTHLWQHNLSWFVFVYIWKSLEFVSCFRCHWWNAEKGVVLYIEPRTDSTYGQGPRFSAANLAKFRGAVCEFAVAMITNSWSHQRLPMITAANKKAYTASAQLPRD